MDGAWFVWCCMLHIALKRAVALVAGNKLMSWLPFCGKYLSHAKKIYKLQHFPHVGG